MYQSFPLNKICRYAEYFLCVGLAAVRLNHRFTAATPRRTTQLNEEKLCQLLANQTRAREKALQQTVTARPQRVVAVQVQHQTSHLKRMAVAVVQNSAQRLQMLRASHVQRAPSSKSALLRLMEQPATAGFQVMSVATPQSVPTVTVTEQLVQSVLHTVAAMTVRLALVTVTHVLHMVTAMTVRLALVTVTHAQATETAMTAAHVVASVQLMVARVQQQVAATVAK
jgi:hypothetical protein